MHTYDELKLNEALFLSFVGINLQQFDTLVQYFEQSWESYIFVFTVSGEYRRRVKKQRNDNVFPDIETMLVFK